MISPLLSITLNYIYNIADLTSLVKPFVHLFLLKPHSDSVGEKGNPTTKDGDLDNKACLDVHLISHFKKGGEVSLPYIINIAV